MLSVTVTQKGASCKWLRLVGFEAVSMGLSFKPHGHPIFRSRIRNLVANEGCLNPKCTADEQKAYDAVPCMGAHGGRWTCQPSLSYADRPTPLLLVVSGLIRWLSYASRNFVKRQSLSPGRASRWAAIPYFAVHRSHRHKMVVSMQIFAIFQMRQIYKNKMKVVPNPGDTPSWSASIKLGPHPAVTQTAGDGDYHRHPIQTPPPLIHTHFDTSLTASWWRNKMSLIARCTDSVGCVRYIPTRLRPLQSSFLEPHSQPHSIALYIFVPIISQ